ncbi:MAG TPA: WYL domain-containing protein [Microbacterium sp.]|uniref:helix-turn-helix transcriptional regulator n=1 Tax=Microbacterium sp. TaxID=51671 RepID=UPI002B5DD8FD|nr:WYL domain-containing protein [Microbacterium sp.]HWI31738.1 WYL domain-containing protein [Microbacterium sp.]
MAETINRALQLLNLLQAHRQWTGMELSDRLGVTERTVRRDIERLRELGYRIESAPGVAGGYRLEAGSAVPPLLLTDEEAVTMAIGLRVAATQRLVHGPETTLTALAKLEQVLPAALRRRVNALAAVVQPIGIGTSPAVSPDILGELALACRDHERIRFTYTSAAGETTPRRVEPHALAPAERHWYLLCWDLEREDWRTFRVDRLADVQHTRVLFEPRPLTAEETEDFFRVAATWVRQPIETDLVMELPLEQMRAHFGQWGQGATEETPTTTRWPVGGADFRETMYGMSWIPAGVAYATDLAEPARGELREVLSRMIAAVDAAPPASREDS